MQCYFKTFHEGHLQGSLAGEEFSQSEAEGRMKINISNLSEGIHEYEFEESPSLSKLDERFSKQIFVKVELEKRRRQLFLTGHIKTSGVFICDRCLTEFEKDMSIDYRMTYVYDRKDADEIEKSNATDGIDEITVIHPGMNEVEIDEDVRQYILISVPLKLLCKENCAGLCPACGKNLNYEICSCAKGDGTDAKSKIDPRWEMLVHKFPRNAG